MVYQRLTQPNGTPFFISHRYSISDYISLSELAECKTQGF